jgi:prepilin-type processing-associated H-X9-DG protein
LDKSAVSHVPASGNALFIDGHVEFIHAREWAAANLPAIPADVAFDEQLLRDIPMEEFYQQR